MQDHTYDYYIKLVQQRKINVKKAEKMDANKSLLGFIAAKKAAAEAEKHAQKDEISQQYLEKLKENS